MTSIGRRSSISLGTPFHPTTSPASSSSPRSVQQLRRDNKTHQNQNQQQQQEVQDKVPKRSLLEDANSTIIMTPMAINTLVPFAPFYSVRRSQPFTPKSTLKAAVQGIQALRKMKSLVSGDSSKNNKNSSENVKNHNNANDDEEESSATSTNFISNSAASVHHQTTSSNINNNSKKSLLNLQANMLAVSGHEDGHLIIWNAENSSVLKRAQQYNHVTISQCVVCNTVMYTLSERHPSLGKSGDDDCITVWDLNTMKITAKLEAHEGRVTCIAVSENDEMKCFSGGTDRMIYEWDLRSKTPNDPVQKFEGHTASVSQLVVGIVAKQPSENEQDEITKDTPSFSTFLISGSGDGQLRLWNTTQAQQQAQQNNNTNNNSTNSASSLSSHVQENAHQGHIERCIWLVTPLEAQRDVSTLQRRQSTVASSLSPILRRSNSQATSTNTKSAAILPLGARRKVTVVEHNNNKDNKDNNNSKTSHIPILFDESAFSSSPSMMNTSLGKLITACSSGTVRCWSCDPEKGFTQLWSFKSHRGLITDIAVDKKNQILAVTSAAEPVVTLYQYETQASYKVSAFQQGGIRRISLDPARKIFLVGADSGALSLYSYEGFVRRHTATTSDDNKKEDENGNPYTSSSADNYTNNTNKVNAAVSTNLEAVSPVGVLQPHLGSITSMLLEVTSQGAWQRLITCAKDQSVFLLDFDTSRGSMTIDDIPKSAMGGLVSRNGFVSIPFTPDENSNNNNNSNSSSMDLLGATGGSKPASSSDLRFLLKQSSGANLSNNNLQEDSLDDGHELTPAEEFYRRMNNSSRNTLTNNKNNNSKPDHRRQDGGSDIIIKPLLPSASVFFPVGDQIRVIDTNGDESGGSSNTSKATQESSFSGLDRTRVTCLHRITLSVSASIACGGGTSLHARHCFVSGSEEGILTVFRKHTSSFNSNSYEMDFSQDAAGAVRCLGSYDSKKQPGSNPPELVRHLCVVGTQHRNLHRKMSMTQSMMEVHQEDVLSQQSNNNINNIENNNNSFTKNGNVMTVPEKHGSVQLIDVRSGEFLGHPVNLSSYPEQVEILFSTWSRHSSSKKEEDKNDNNDKNKSKTNNKKEKLGSTAAKDFPEGTIFVICHLRNGTVVSVEFDLELLLLNSSQQQGGCNNSKDDHDDFASSFNGENNINPSLSEFKMKQKPYIIRELVQSSPPKFFVPPFSTNNDDNQQHHELTLSELISAANDIAERSAPSVKNPPRCKVVVSINNQFEPPRLVVHYIDHYSNFVSRQLELVSESTTSSSSDNNKFGSSSENNSHNIHFTVQVSDQNVVDLSSSRSFPDQTNEILDFCPVQAGGIAFAVAMSVGTTKLLYFTSSNNNTNDMGSSVGGTSLNNIALEVGAIIHRDGQFEEIDFEYSLMLQQQEKDRNSLLRRKSSALGSSGGGASSSQHLLSDVEDDEDDNIMSIMRNNTTNTNGKSATTNNNNNNNANNASSVASLLHQNAQRRKKLSRHLLPTSTADAESNIKLSSTSVADNFYKQIAKSSRCVFYDRSSRCLAIGFGDGVVLLADLPAKRICRRVCVSSTAPVVQVYIAGESRIVSVTADDKIRFDVIHSRNLGV